MHHEITIRPMREDDIPTFVAIESDCYPAAVCEGLEFFREFTGQHGTSCWVATSSANDTAVGYVLSLPIKLSECPLKLQSHHDAKESSIASYDNDDSDTFYLHDMAVTPVARGKGIGHKLFDVVLDFADTRHLSTITLTSIGADEYWALCHGFVAMTNLSMKPQHRLATYPHDCGKVRMMQRTVTKL